MNVLSNIVLLYNSFPSDCQGIIRDFSQMADYIHHRASCKKYIEEEVTYAEACTYWFMTLGFPWRGWRLFPLRQIEYSLAKPLYIILQVLLTTLTITDKVRDLYVIIIYDCDWQLKSPKLHSSWRLKIYNTVQVGRWGGGKSLPSSLAMTIASSFCWKEQHHLFGSTCVKNGHSFLW